MFCFRSRKSRKTKMFVVTWSDYCCKVSAGLFKFVPSYIARIDELTSWSDRKNIMRTAFLQFCTANKKHFPASMFSHDENIGMFPVDIKVVAAFLSYLRYKGGDVAVPINTCYLMEGARGYTPSAHRTAHVIDSSAPAIPQVTGTLTMVSPPTAPVTGTDRFGTFSKVTVGWRATSSAGETAAFATSFRTYTDGRTVVWEQQISSGAKRKCDVSCYLQF